LARRSHDRRPGTKGEERLRCERATGLRQPGLACRNTDRPTPSAGRTTAGSADGPEASNAFEPT
jgi:hypothetical protein